MFITYRKPQTIQIKEERDFNKKNKGNRSYGVRGKILVYNVFSKQVFLTSLLVKKFFFCFINFKRKRRKTETGTNLFFRLSTEINV